MNLTVATIAIVTLIVIIFALSSSIPSIQSGISNLGKPSKPQCNDKIDNDRDGLIDYPSDPGCGSRTDQSELNPNVECDDGKDNDGDGIIDMLDSGCTSPTDNDETNCGDKVDQVCPSGCTAGSDADCCINDGKYWLQTPWGYGCYNSNYNPGCSPGQACSSTKDNCCPNWCAPGSDYDCCINDGKCWSNNSCNNCPVIVKKIPPCNSYGDVNGDRYITADDSTLISNYISGSINFTSNQKIMADVNRDGKITNDDISLINKLLSGEISVFFPICAQPNLLKGWNSFSSILKEGISLDEMELYCNPEVIYRWDTNSNQYIMEKNRIEAGVGYYIAQLNGCTLLNIPGNPYTLMPMNLSAGKWYFIGSQYDIVKVADIAGSCPMNYLTVQTRNYSTSEYVNVDKIEPWKSYWIKSDVDCTFGLEPSINFSIPLSNFTILPVVGKTVYSSASSTDYNAISGLRGLEITTYLSNFIFPNSKWLSEGESITVGDLKLELNASYSGSKAKIYIRDKNGTIVWSGMASSFTSSVMYGNDTYKFNVLESFPPTSSLLKGGARIVFVKNGMTSYNKIYVFYYNGYEIAAYDDYLTSRIVSLGTNYAKVNIDTKSTNVIISPTAGIILYNSTSLTYNVTPGLFGLLISSNLDNSIEIDGTTTSNAYYLFNDGHEFLGYYDKTTSRIVRIDADKIVVS
ncbi:MAG: dockerin type I repeat-containing protein [Candidatus Aenigmatarchaeota archaeon]